MSGKLQTEFEFELPQGYVDDEGNLHKKGRMRLATAADEIEPLQNRRVQSNQSYLTIILLSRVVTELGGLDTITPSVIENLFVADLEHLQRLYERINNRGANIVSTACPECGEMFDVSADTGEVVETSPMDTGPEIRGGGISGLDISGGVPGEMGSPPEGMGGPPGEMGSPPGEMGGAGMDVPDHEPDVGGDSGNSDSDSDE